MWWLLYVSSCPLQEKMLLKDNYPDYEAIIQHRNKKTTKSMPTKWKKTDNEQKKKYVRKPIVTKLMLHFLNYQVLRQTFKEQFPEASLRSVTCENYKIPFPSHANSTKTKFLRHIGNIKIKKHAIILVTINTISELWSLKISIQVDG